MRRVLLMLLMLLVGVSAMGSAPIAAGTAAGPFPDVPANHWAATAIKAVAVDHAWMGALVGKEFRPDALETRARFARTLVAAFAPGAKPASVAFADLPSSSPLYPAAAIAVSRNWMGAPGGTFAPYGAVTKIDVDRGLAVALGLTAELNGLDTISTADGTPLAHSKEFPVLSIGASLGLWFNHSVEAKDVLPASAAPRADVAYALWRAATAKGTWRTSALQRFRTITLPATTPERRAVIEFALRWVGYPYVYAGEWYQATTKDFCCGTQPIGGFDCSGFVWWVLREPSTGFPVTSVRPYQGWPLGDRSSFEMARNTVLPLALNELKAGDLALSNASGTGGDWQSINHVGVAMGGGWMIHSSSPGVVIEWIGDGWWAQHFRWGRRLIPDMSDSATGGAQAGDGSWQDSTNH